MTTLVKCIMKANGMARKIYEETSIFGEELFKKYMRENPKRGEVYILFNEEGGAIFKGVRPKNLNEIKPIL